MPDIKKAIDFARQNPDDPRSIELRRRMESGQLNPELQAAGFRTFAIEQPRPDISKADTQKIQERAGFKEGLQSKIPEPKTFTQDVAEDVSRAGKGLVSDFGERGRNVLNIFKSDQDPISKGFQLVGEVFGGAVDIAERGVEAAVTAAVPQKAETFVIEKAKALLDTPGGQAAAEAIAGGMEKWGEFKESNPTLAANLEAAFNITELLTIGTGAPIVAEATIKGGKKVVEVAKPIVKEVAEKVVETAKDVTEATSRRVGEVLDEKRLARIDANKGKVDEAVGRIVQGKPGDIEQAKRALTNLDTTGVKTFEQLGNTMEDQVEALSRKLDDFLDVEDAKLPPLKPKDLTTSTKVGDEIISQNFVDDAFKQLDELYSTIKDAPARARVNQLQQKFETAGLTRKEINNLAREYGSQFRRKAFSKLGDPLTSVNAQAFENTRKGIKAAFRDTIEGDIPKQLDGQISDLLNTKILTDKMEVKVNGLFQKVKKRGLLKRISQSLGSAVDIATFGTVSGFISRFLPSQVGLKTMNSLDIEEELIKNLKIIDDLGEKATDDEIVKALTDLMKANQ